MSSQVIKYKLPLRIVQNCHITFNNVVVSAEQRLPKANDFASGTNIILKHSRIFVCWVAAGIAMGVYDNAIKYVSNRKQFGHPISGIFFNLFEVSNWFKIRSLELWLILKLSFCYVSESQN